jgi:hypothetical protein
MFRPQQIINSYAKGFDGRPNLSTCWWENRLTEGAAGSKIYTLPVAIRSYETSGKEQTFAGCYTLKLANPQIQADDFKPMAIERGALQPTIQEFEDAIAKIVRRQCNCRPTERQGRAGPGDVCRRARSADCRLAASENDEPRKLFDQVSLRARSRQ